MAILVYFMLAVTCLFGVLFLTIAFLHDRAEYEERADAGPLYSKQHAESEELADGQPICSNQQELDSPECIPTIQHWDQGVRVGS